MSHINEEGVISYIHNSYDSIYFNRRIYLKISRTDYNGKRKGSF